MGVKTILFVLILVSVIAIVEGVPVPDYTLYGSVTVDGTKLTKDDSSVITLTLEGAELVKFTMGDVDADAYVLRVPMNSEATPGYAQTGDSVRIFVDGREVDQSPITVGDFGTTVKLDISVGSTPSSDEPEDETPVETTTTGRSSGGGGGSSSSGSSGSEPDVETVTVPVPELYEKEVAEEDEEEPEPTLIEQQETSQVKEDTLLTGATVEEEKIGFFQRILNFLGIGKETTPTGEAVAEVPKAKPLIGILIALVIVAVGLAVAYFLIFSREQ